jgi:hypothetical protein
VHLGDLSAKGAELTLLYFRLRQDTNIREKLDVELNRLIKINQPYAQGQVQKALDQIFGPDLHEQYLKWLQQFADKQELAEQMLKDGSRASPTTQSPIASAIQIVDPDQKIWDLAKVPGINPDFVDAMRRQFQLLQRGDLQSVTAAGMVDKYFDGSYIPAFLDSGQLNNPGDPSPGDFSSAIDRARQNQDSFNREFEQTQAQVNNLQDQIVQAQDQLKSAEQTVASANQQIGSKPISLPRPRIPAAWVPCTCPDRHPHAGLLVGGTRYHSAELHCDRYF